MENIFEVNLVSQELKQMGNSLYYSCEAKLTAEERRALPNSAFALPGRRYPVFDRDHAIAAKARAKEQLDKGFLTKKEYHTVIRKADEVLGEDDKK